MNDDKIIEQSDIDLTEQELNKIFFSPGDIKSHPIGVKKVEKRKVIKKESEHKIEEKEESKIEAEEKPTKRPQGRPKKWTKEKIEELKLLKKKEAEERKKQKEELIDVARLSLDTPLSSYERTKVITKQLEYKKEIEKEIIDEKTKNKKSLNQTDNIYLRNKPKCEDHKYKVLYFDSNGGVVASCNICSKQIIMPISEWTRYIQKTRRL